MALYIILTKDKIAWKSVEFNNQDHKRGKLCLLSAKFNSPLVPGHIKKNPLFYASLAFTFGCVTGCELTSFTPVSGTAHNSSHSPSLFSLSACRTPKVLKP